MISGTVLAAALAALAAAADAPAAREPFRLVNEAGFTASCTLMSVNYALDPLKLHPGETYERKFPLKRDLRLICINGKTRDTPLRPGRTYRLIEVEGHLEIAPDAPAPAP